MRIVGLCIFALLFGAVKSMRVDIIQGNVWLIEGNQKTQISVFGNASEPQLSPDGKRLVYVQDISNEKQFTDGEQHTRICSVDLPGDFSLFLIQESAEKSLKAMHSPRFSPDGSCLYFLNHTSKTSDSLCCYDFHGPMKQNICAANSVDVIAHALAPTLVGKLIIQQHRYHKNGNGSYDWYYLFSPEGKELRTIGEELDTFMRAQKIELTGTVESAAQLTSVVTKKHPMPLLPRFFPKVTTKAFSPDGTHIAYTKEYATTSLDETHKLHTWEKHNDLYISKIDGSEERPLFIADYAALNGGRCGVRHFAWSPDSRLIVFDFIVNNIGELVLDAQSFIGVVNIEKHAGHFLEENGCEPNFSTVNHSIGIEFLSWQQRSGHSKLGIAKYCDLKNKVYYLNTRPIGIAPTKAFSFQCNKRKDMGELPN